MDSERLGALAVALGVGFIVGLQREKSAADEHRKPLAGVRTFPLVALSGALGVLLAPPLGAWIVGAAFLSLIVPLTLAYADDLRRGRDPGFTTEITLVVTFLLGCATTVDLGPARPRLLLCAAIAVAVTALLSYKDPLHRLASKMSTEDLTGAVKFGILAAIVLPLLPDKGYGPYQALNPAKIGLFIVIVAALGFAGYVAVRVLGPGKGLGVTGLLGGLVSSTAITVSFSSRAKQEPKAAWPCMLGILLASSVLGLRVLGLVAVTNRSLLAHVALPVGALAATGFAAGGLVYWLRRKDRAAAEAVDVANPFDLGSALKFGLIFALVLLGSKAAVQEWGKSGGFVAAVVAGGVDVDAVVISLARMPAEQLPPREAALGIFLACASNTLVKAGIALALGGWLFGRWVLASFLAMVAAGAGGAAFLLLQPQASG